MLDSTRPSFNMTRDQIDHFPIIFTKNIQRFKENPENKDESLTLFYLEKTRNTILELQVNNNIDKINERLNKAGPKEATVIQKTINDIKSIIENEDPNIKITQEFQKIVNYIEKESKNKGGKSLFISSAIQGLEAYIRTSNNFKSIGVGDAKEIDKELYKDTRLLELVQTFYKDYLETHPLLQTHNDILEKRNRNFIVIGKKSKTENQDGKPRNL